jgi:integrase
MKNKSAPLEVRPFENSNGVTSYRVDGYINGIRIRKNFKSRAEAAAEKSAIELCALQAASGLRHAATLLTEEQLREAETVFNRIKDAQCSLSFCAEYTLSHYRAPNRQQLLESAMTEYVASKNKEHARGVISMRQVRSVEHELRALKKHFPAGTVDQFTPDILTRFIDRGTPSLKTYNNRRGILSTFFKFSYQKDWIASNPIEKTTYYRINHSRGSAVTISAETAAAVMDHAEEYKNGILAPYFALCLFAGIRPCIRYGEIAKVKSESVNLETGGIHIEPTVSKVKMKRIVTIQPNLARWLAAYPLKDHPIIPRNAVKMRLKFFRKFGLTHDVLRHTFISMYVAKYRSMAEAALQAGNSEAIIKKHYLDIKSPSEAEAFFSIMPKRGLTKAKNVAVEITQANEMSSKVATATISAAQLQAV